MTKERTESITQGRREEADGVAGKEEILRFWTELMQDQEKADIKTRLKAAELLGKQAGLFDKEAEEKQGERPSVVIVDDIP